VAFKAALGADLNVAGAIGALNEATGQYDLSVAPARSDNGGPTYEAELEALRAMNSVLGVLDLETEGRAETGDLDVGRIDTLIADRLTARSEKNWSEADRIRDELLEMGIAIKDGPEGTTWEKVVQ
jgi:cysteinyl-tRNA synthetase